MKFFTEEDLEILMLLAFSYYFAMWILNKILNGEL